MRRNSVADLEEIQFLKNLPCLKVLWLSDNPCSESDNYRSTILKNLPNIQKLDNIGIHTLNTIEWKLRMLFSFLFDIFSYV